MNPTLSVILNVNIQDTNQKAEADQMDFLKKKLNYMLPIGDPVYQRQTLKF